MKDYLVEVKVRNNWMLQAMATAGFDSAQALHSASGVTLGVIYGYLALNRPFVKLNGDWRDTVIKLSETLRCLPETLVPPRHVEDALEKNRAAFEMDAVEVEFLIESRGGPDPLALIEDKERSRAVANAMSTLSLREQSVIDSRFGTNGAEVMTLHEIAERWGVTRERVRQIETQALRKLKYPTRSKTLRQFSNSRGADAVNESLDEPLRTSKEI